MYAYLLLVVSVFWLGYVGRVVYLQGLGRFDLSDAVMVTLLSTTTGHVLATLYFVARYLFPSQRGAGRWSPPGRRR